MWNSKNISEREARGGGLKCEKKGQTSEGKRTQRDRLKVNKCTDIHKQTKTLSDREMRRTEDLQTDNDRQTESCWTVISFNN